MTSFYDSSYTAQCRSSFDVANIAGKGVVITGGGSGIGEAIARAFVKAGAFVTIGDWNQENGERVCAELGSEHAKFVKTNVAEWEDQIRLFQIALEAAPSRSLDVVVANAGHSGRDPIYWDDAGLEEDAVKPDLQIVQSCLIGCIFTIKLGMHHFKRQKMQNTDGCLILMGSIAGYVEQPGTPLYSASKGGIRSLMRSLRLTLPRDGMRINTIAPWYIRTAAIPKANQELLTSKGVEWAESGDAASAALHIAADEKLNGRCLAVVPRTVVECGYADLDEDDYPPDHLLAKFQQTMIHASQRA